MDQMEEEILAAETHLAACQSRADDPSIATDSLRLQEATLALHVAQERVDKLYARWAELEAKVR